MTPDIMVRAAARPAPRPPVRTRTAVKAQRRRFDLAARRTLADLARKTDRIDDLMFSFPAAAFALGVERGSPAARARALTLVAEGAPLGTIAAALELPLWTRRLAPEAFRAPLGPVFDAPDAAKRLPQLAPSSGDALRAWFEWVGVAGALGGPELAFWVARQSAMFRRYRAEPGGWTAERGRDAVELLAAYVFALNHPDELVGMVAEGSWSDKASVARVAEGARTWLRRVYGDLCEVEAPDGWRWRQTQFIGAFEFAPLRSRDALEEEGRRMDNCVESYWGYVRESTLLIYSIRRAGRGVATLAIRAGARPGSAEISELEGPGNTSAPRDVADAVEAWMAAQGPCPLRARGARAPLVDPEAWATIWAPFLAAVPARCEARLFSRRPRERTLDLIEQALDLLDAIAIRSR